MVRGATRPVRVLTCAALVFALALSSSARCLAEAATIEAKMACCEAMGQHCDHASLEQGCCVTNAPDQGSPALASRVDHVKAPTVALLTVNDAWQSAPVAAVAAVGHDPIPKHSSRPTYLLVSTFRI